MMANRPPQTIGTYGTNVNTFLQPIINFNFKKINASPVIYYIFASTTVVLNPSVKKKASTFIPQISLLLWVKFFTLSWIKFSIFS